MVLEEKDILARIKKPYNKTKILEAKEMEQELKAFTTREENQRFILDEVEKIVVPEKFNKFEETYQNVTVDIIDKCTTEYSRIFDAYERNINFDFGKDANTELSFEKYRKQMYMGISDEEYWRKSIKRIFDTPHNTLFVEIAEVQVDGQLIELPIVKEYSIEYVWDIEADYAGIKFIIYSEVREDKTTFYFGCDSEKYFSVKADKDGNFSEYQEVSFENDHSIPVCWMWKKELGNPLDSNFILKKSLLYDSITDLYDYSITKNANRNYKYLSSYPTEVRPETKTRKVDQGSPNRDYSGSIVIPSALRIQNTTGAGQNPAEMLGANFKVPVNELDDKQLDAFIKAHFRLDADVGILKFHAENIAAHRIKILSDIVGEGFGESLNREAINEKQANLSFDSRENNLNNVKENIEYGWKYVNDVCASIFANTFTYSVVFLGDEYFLKSSKQLNEELEQMTKAKFPQAQIQEKIRKINLTENRANPAYLETEKILSFIQPFQLFSREEITQNSAYAQVRYPLYYDMYLNFNSVIRLFELQYGKIHEYANDLSFQERVMDIKDKFYEILETDVMMFNNPNQDSNIEGQGNQEDNIEE